MFIGQKFATGTAEDGKTKNSLEFHRCASYLKFKQGTVFETPTRPELAVDEMHSEIAGYSGRE